MQFFVTARVVMFVSCAWWQATCLHIAVAVHLALNSKILRDIDTVSDSPRHKFNKSHVPVFHHHPYTLKLELNNAQMTAWRQVKIWWQFLDQLFHKELYC